MGRSFEINNAPEKVRAVLSALKKDKHLSETFEGEAGNGELNGFYTKIAKYNGGIVMGYVKIKGTYNRDTGDMSVKAVPSYLFLLVISVVLIPISWTVYKGVTENSSFLFASLFCLILALGWTLAFYLESKGFIKHLHRIANSDL